MISWKEQWAVGQVRGFPGRIIIPLPSKRELWSLSLWFLTCILEIIAMPPAEDLSEK